jgi:hypothetical protein
MNKLPFGMFIFTQIFYAAKKIKIFHSFVQHLLVRPSSHNSMGSMGFNRFW